MKNSILNNSPQITTIEAQQSIGNANAEAFQSQLVAKILDRATSVLLIDMTRVEFLDSAGLMALISAYRLAVNLNRRLSFCSVGPSVQMIFELTQLDRKFEIFESRHAFNLTLA